MCVCVCVCVCDRYAFENYLTDFDTSFCKMFLEGRGRSPFRNSYPFQYGGRNAIRPMRLHDKSITYGNYTISNYNQLFTLILGFVHTDDVIILPYYRNLLTMLQQPAFNKFSLLYM